MTRACLLRRVDLDDYLIFVATVRLGVLKDDQEIIGIDVPQALGTTAIPLLHEWFIKFIHLRQIVPLLASQPVLFGVLLDLVQKILKLDFFLAILYNLQFGYEHLPLRLRQSDEADVCCKSDQAQSPCILSPFLTAGIYSTGGVRGWVTGGSIHHCDYSCERTY